MQISSNYNTLFNRISQVYGKTATTTSKVSQSSGTSSSSSTDQADLSDDYVSFQSFLDKVKNGTVTDDDLTKMQDAMNTSGQMQMPPPPQFQTAGTGSSDESNTIGSFMDKVKNGTVTSDDLTNMESVLSTTGSSADANTVSSTGSNSQLTFQSFMDKVKNGTVTQDDLTQMQTKLQEMGQTGSHHVHHRHSAEMTKDNNTSDSTDSVSSSTASTVSSTSSSDGTDSLTLESFLDKVKNGTVTDNDLTQMQAKLKEMDQNASQNVQNRPPMPPSLMDFMGLGSSDSSSSSTSPSSSSDSTDSLTLQSFLDKIKNGTVTDDDLTEMQSMLQNWMNSTSESSGTSQVNSL